MKKSECQALRLAVVGHTNTGKTSLIRTLLHRRDFGDIHNRSGSTRQVASAALAIDGETLITLFDSPGLEDAPGLIDWLDEQGGQRHEGPDRIHRLLTDRNARARFDHEARVLDLMLNVDVALYVIDAREPVLEKYQDELAVLALCARPILAVLNFVVSPDSREYEWRDALAKVGLHTVLAFDAVVRDPATERRLFEKLAAQLDAFAPTLQAWLEHRALEEHQRLAAATQTIAEMLIDVAAAERLAELGSASAQASAMEDLQAAVREREQICVATLLDLYRFGREDYADHDLPLSDGRWSEDLFDPDTLQYHGIRTGGHIGAGAGAGAIVDVATGGLSLGAGTVLGAAVGAGVGLARGFGAQIGHRLRGRVRLMVEDATLRLLAWRQLQLLAQLRLRGHAAQRPLAPDSQERWSVARLPSQLRAARQHPTWSSLNVAELAGSRRLLALSGLAELLRRSLEQGSAGPRQAPERGEESDPS